MITLHQIAIEKVKLRRRPETLKTTGVNGFLKHLDKELGMGFGPEDFFGRRPDAWSYEPDPRPSIPGTLRIYEIEDTSMLSVDKLRDYADLWFNFDDLDLSLELFVYDRYGEHERQLCLCEYWLMFLVEDLKLDKNKFFDRRGDL